MEYVWRSSSGLERREVGAANVLKVKRYLIEMYNH